MSQELFSNVIAAAERFFTPRRWASRNPPHLKSKKPSAEELQLLIYESFSQLEQKAKYLAHGIAIGNASDFNNPKDISAMQKETSVDRTLAERGARYGKFEDHAKIAQGLQDQLRKWKGWDHLAPDQKQALTTICDKIARILNGDPDYIDNWHDIQGYAKLVEDRLQKLLDGPQDSMV